LHPLVVDAEPISHFPVHGLDFIGILEIALYQLFRGTSHARRGAYGSPFGVRASVVQKQIDNLRLSELASLSARAGPSP
jgi:hypothetical protein